MKKEKKKEQKAVDETAAEVVQEEQVALQAHAPPLPAKKNKKPKEAAGEPGNLPRIQCQRSVSMATGINGKAKQRVPGDTFAVAMVDGEMAGTKAGDLVTVVKTTQLSDAEIQTLIEVLLNKQGRTGLPVQWTKVIVKHFFLSERQTFRRAVSVKRPPHQ